MSRRTAFITVGALLVLAVGAGTVLADPGGMFAPTDNPWPYSNPGPAPVLATVGDISCQPEAPVGTEKSTDVCTGGAFSNTRNEAQTATAEQVEAMSPALVAVLGDEQYENGYYQDFENSFDKY
jgi:hypothetical protein